MAASNKGSDPTRNRADSASEARRLGRPPRDPDAPRVPIGRRLRALLEHRGLPHDELRRITGVSKSAVSSWMNAHSYPTIEQLVQICDALDVSADVLLGRKPLVLE